MDHHVLPGAGLLNMGSAENSRSTRLFGSFAPRLLLHQMCLMPTPSFKVADFKAADMAGVSVWAEQRAVQSCSSKRM